jgi:hypothetical protein
MAEVIDYLEALVRNTQKTETELVAMAFKTGLRQLWREQVLARYLQGAISREEAIQQVGIDWVDLAERQHAAMLEDVEWAMGK